MLILVPFLSLDTSSTPSLAGCLQQFAQDKKYHITQFWRWGAKAQGEGAGRQTDRKETDRQIDRDRETKTKKTTDRNGGRNRQTAIIQRQKQTIRGTETDRQRKKRERWWSEATMVELGESSYFLAGPFGHADCLRPASKRDCNVTTKDSSSCLVE